jgi:TonB-dependent receptor
MRLQMARVLICLGWAAWSYQSAAQDGQQGAVRGRVVDAEFFQAVPGAELSLEGTQIKVQSQDDGSFFFNEVQPGVYTILAGRSGYTRERASNLVVSAGKVTETEIRLTAEVVELDDFVVSVEDIIQEASALSPASLVADMQSFSTSIGSEFLSKLGGGGDIGNAVKRLAGTSVVDSRYVVIRGLSDRYNVVVLNAARLPSSDPDKRAVNIDIFPSNLVETIVSSKTFTPDMPGEATGGFLNVVTKSIPAAPFVNFSVGTAYNTQSSLNPNFLTYKGGGTGFLGTASDRALPGSLKITNLDTLPLDNPTFRGFNPPSIAPSQEVANNRDSSARLLSGRTMGVDTTEAPMDFTFSLSAGTAIEDFMGGRLGVIGALSYAKAYKLKRGFRGNDSLFRDPVTQQNLVQTERLFYYEEGEESLLAGGLLSIGWQGDEQDTIKLTVFSNLAAEDQAQFAIGEDDSTNNMDDGFNPIEEGLPIIRESLVYTERKLSTIQLSGEHVFDDDRDIKVDWAAAYAWSSQDQPDIRFSNYGFDIPNNQFFGLSNDIPGERFERIWRTLDDTNYNLNLNIEIPFGESSNGKERSKIKFGGAFDHSDRVYNTENFAYKVDFLPQPIGYSIPRVLGPSDRGGLTLADQLGRADLTDSFQSPPDFNIDSTYLARTRTPPGTENYIARQNIAATYVMSTFNVSEDVEVVAGARVESTDITVRSGSAFDSLDPLAGGFIFNDLITGEPIPIEEVLNPGIQATDLLPAMAVSWDFAEKMTLRSSVSRTIARPTFKEIAPVLARDPTSGAFFIGNVRLDRSEIINYDIRAEWLPTPGDLVVLSVFSKEITSPIEAVNLGSIQSVFNEEAATIYGFEIELAKKLLEWGPLLDDITLGFNYSKMTSQVELTDFTRAGREIAGLEVNRQLQGQPDYTMNFNAQYDNEDFGFSAAIFLNITGELLYQVGGVSGSTVAPDVVQETFTSLDLSFSKELFDDWQLRFRVGNLLNTERRRMHRSATQTGAPFDTSREGTLYSISLSKKW